MSQKRKDETSQTVERDSGTPHYSGASGGWGSLKGIAGAFGETRNSPLALRVLMNLNKTEGIMCPSCAWAKPAKPHAFEFCENGAKATLWELTPKRCAPEFFARHSVTRLRGWHDHDLEGAGRLTHPLRFDPATDRYAPVSWDQAFAEIGRELKALDPAAAVFYSSGHAGLEAAYLYALFARLYGTNNLPQSSNMCHETTSVGLSDVIGVPVGTCTLDDFERCDAIFVFGHNTGTNSPRFLRELRAAAKRGCRIVTFNPLREKGLLEFVDPQDLVQMTVGKPTRMSDAYFQLRPGGDIAVLAGMIKRVLEAEDRSPGAVLDRDFIRQHTTGFEGLDDAIRRIGWDMIERHSGLSRAMIGRAADIYLGADSVIGIYGMGLTQHANGWLNLAMLVNLLLLRGHIGRPGAGISPVRGHSNVQGQRTVGIAEKPELVPLDKLESLFGFKAPRERGRNLVRACEGILDGSVKALVSLGGNLARAVPDRARMEMAWPRLRLTAHIATKLNRSHLAPGQVSFILPCLGRTDADVQGSGPQAVTVEDSLSHIYGSIGRADPPSGQLRSELAIVAGMASATLQPNPAVRWEEWTANYDRVRDLIARTYPEEFHDFNDRLFEPGGFYRGNAARERRWNTPGGKAVFTVPETLSGLGAEAQLTDDDPDRMTLVTLRSNDQFNTTIYGFSDRLRGLKGSREIVLIHPDEMSRLGLSEGQSVSLVCDIHDGIERKVGGLTVTPYDLPARCVAGYFPELNPLVPLGYHDRKSQTPAYKGTPVRIERE